MNNKIINGTFINMKRKIYVLFSFCLVLAACGQKRNVVSDNKSSLMMFSDTSRFDRPWAKDPTVIHFQNRYLMYYSVPPYTDILGVKHGLGIGIAESIDLTNWTRIGDINIDNNATYEKNGIGAPCALVINNEVHLFYQTYGNGVDDAICHSYSADGIIFTRNSTNPVFSPDGDWNCGRAIDAEVVKFKDNYYLYYATRDPDYKIQMLGVATAPANTSFNKDEWKHLSFYEPILKPELSWETKCIEAPSILERDNNLYMFYAGGYNNDPQQIGVAISNDGVNWERLSVKPILENGKEGTWNSSESGHPEIFEDIDKKVYLFYQGNNNNGHTWFLSKKSINWRDVSLPFIFD